MASSTGTQREHVLAYPSVRQAKFKLRHYRILPPGSVVVGSWEWTEGGAVVLDPLAADLLLGGYSDEPVTVDAEAFAAIMHRSDRPAAEKALREAAEGCRSLLIGYRIARPGGECLIVQRGAFGRAAAGIRGAGVFVVAAGPVRDADAALAEMAEACIWLKHAVGRYEGDGFTRTVLVDMLLIEIGRKLAEGTDPE